MCGCKRTMSILLSNSFTIPRFHVPRIKLFKGNSEISTLVKKKKTCYCLMKGTENGEGLLSNLLEHLLASRHHNCMSELQNMKC